MSKTRIPEDIAALAHEVGNHFKSERDRVDYSRLLVFTIGCFRSQAMPIPLG